MKNHVLRPLYVFIGIVVLIFVARIFLVPKDFGIGERGFMYGWHRKGNEQDWKDFKVKYSNKGEIKGMGSCKDCHSDKYNSIMKTPHHIIPCEDCHGPAMDHPADPPKLTIVKGQKQKAMCLRCHYPLPYPTSHRSEIKSIDPTKHNPDAEQCSDCHNPHNPMGGLR